MEKAYLGEIDAENLDWIDKRAAQSGKINISDLLKAILKNDSNVEK